MTKYRPGDVVLVPFPFTDLSTSKRRPALVLTAVAPKKLPPLLIVAMVTSQIDAEMIPGDVIVTDWEIVGLIHPSKVRLAKLVTLEELMVVGRLNALSRKDWKAMKIAFFKLFSF